MDEQQDSSTPTVSATSPKQAPKTPPRPIRDPPFTLPPPPKRRRLHSTAIASPAARKPFKSPLAVSSAPQPSFPLKASPPALRSPPFTSAPLTSTPPQPAKPTRPKFKTPVKARAEDAEIRTLRERKRELERECAAVEERVRRARLVRVYRDKNEEETTEALISKWRRVAQDAATHLFAQFRNNPVSTAVSPTTWGQDGRSNWGWDDQPQEGGSGSGSGSGSGKDGTGEEPGQQQQMMTMDLMLRSMGIDLGLIGWSVEEEGFVAE